MKKRNGSLLHRMLSVLLSAVLVTGMVSNAEPVSVLAQEEMQESVSGNAVEIPEGDIAPEEETEPAEGTEPDEGAGQETQELGTISTNDIGTASVAEPQSVMMAAEPAPQANNIASGNDWVLDADGKLTISSDDGMADWENYMRGDYEYYTRQVVNVEIQDGVTSLGNNAFYNYGELTGITIADSVTSIAGSAFCGCWKLKKITIPNNVTSISDRMFMNSGLEEITILGSVTSIGEFAFWGCGLKKITIPDSVKSIGEKAFIYCDNLNEVIIKSETPPTLGDGVFTDCGFVKDNTQSIHVPEGKAQAYKTAWTDWAAYIADDTPTPPTEEHKHNDVTFTAWTATDSLPTDPGNYYLTDNVTLSATWNVPDDETNLCLNGKTISASGTDTYRVITIPMSGTLNLYDCQNAGNITGGKGGGVWNSNGGTFCMYGGKISGNSKVNGVGGVSNNGTFYMYGGEISGNTAENGIGGVETYGKFSMYGGKIRNNECNGEWASGGGVYINGGGSFTVGGSAVIGENTCNGKEENVYLSNNRRRITIDSSNPLSNSANIGVTTAVTLTDGNPVNITGENSADYSSFFTSDNPDYEIVNANDTVQLVVKQAQTQTYTVTVHNGAGGGEYAAGATVTITADTPASGKQFDKWEVNSGSVTLADATSSITTFTMPAGAVTVTATYKDKTGGDMPGTVTPEIKPGDNAPATNISTPAEELKDMLLTEEEKQQVQNGTNIRIVLEVQDAGNTVSASDRAAVQQALNGFTEGQYLNIDLYKLVGADRTDITETTEKIRIVVTVPDSLKNAGSSKTRTFAVIRLHNGSAEFLTDLDGSDDTITIDTDRFSTYAIVYKDTANSGSGGENSGNDDNHGSDDENNGGGNDNGGNGNNDGGNDNGGNGNNGGGNDSGSNGNNGGGNDNGGNGNNGGGNDNNGGGSDNGNNGNDNSSQSNSDKNDTKPGSTKDNEPRTGDNTPLELYATLTMIAGLAYLLLYFTDRRRGMTEETKKELVSRLVGWAKQGGRIRKYLALAAVFALLVYYHSIGKKTCVEWQEIYGE